MTERIVTMQSFIIDYVSIFCTRVLPYIVSRLQNWWLLKNWRLFIYKNFSYAYKTKYMSVQVLHCLYLKTRQYDKNYFSGWSSGWQEGGVPHGHHHRGRGRRLPLRHGLAPHLLLLLLSTKKKSQTVSPFRIYAVILKLVENTRYVFH